jgi:hypothetical protein
MDQLLTTREAADILAVSPKTLETWRGRSDSPLPFVRLAPRVIRYRARDVARLTRNTASAERVAA